MGVGTGGGKAAGTKKVAGRKGSLRTVSAGIKSLPRAMKLSRAVSAKTANARQRKRG